MHLEYISHSCFAIVSEGIRVAFDPWITGTAYQKQWFLYPPAVDYSLVEKADILLLSHGHEDHLHHESLKKINKSAHVFFPFQWRDGIADYLQAIGYNFITEAISFKTYAIKGIQITYLGYSLESVIVVECEGLVIVNINDSLNSNHETAVDFLLNKIRQKWNKIDFLLSGWSGAGYFPNKVHYKGKNDLEVARIREQYFADNFCKFTKFLQPEIAVPFAPGFVLLNKNNRWINEIKFPRQIVNEYYRKNFDSNSKITFPIPYPGDYFTNKQFHKISQFHQLKSDHDLYSNLDDVFKEEIAFANNIANLNENDLKVLIDKLTFWLNKNKNIYPVEVLQDAIFSIELEDFVSKKFLNIAYLEGLFRISGNDCSTAEDRLVIKTRGHLLSKNLDKMWGGDLLSIGYGIDVEVFEELSLEKNLDIVCVRLISRYPVFKEDALKNISRVIKYYFRNPALTNLWIKQKIKLRPYVNKYPFNERDHWITYNKCDLCQVCKMPEIDFDLLNKNPHILHQAEQQI